MSEYQRIVDDVRIALVSRSSDAEAMIRDAAAAYASACAEVNERVRQCEAYLRGGLRSEAVRLCELEPNLLDALSILDFAERGDWLALLDLMNVPLPPPLPLEIAAELNEAYALEQPMEGLLRQHRLLALIRAPLRARIEVLKQLAETDSDNSLWLEDLRTFERERLRQIQREASEASQSGDLDALNRLVDELQPSRWRDLPPDALVQLVERAADHHRVRLAGNELESLAPPLLQAFQDRDRNRACVIRETWNRIVASCAAVADRPLPEPLIPVFDWLQEEDRRLWRAEEQTRRIAALERAIDDELPREAVVECYEAAMERGATVPEALEAAYRECLGDWDAAVARIRRRRRWVAVGIVLAIGVVCAGVVYRGMQWSLANTAKADLERFLEERRFSEADAYLTTLETDHPAVAATPAIRSFRAALVEADRNETARKERFERCLQAIRGRLPEPDPAIVEQARRVAESEEEKKRLLELETTIDEHDRKTRSDQETAFHNEVRRLNERLAALQAGGAGEPAVKRRAALRELRVELSACTDRYPKVRGAIKDQARPLWTALEAAEEALRIAIDDEVRIGMLDRVVGDPARFKNELQRVLDLAPQSPLNGDFRRVLAEAPLWSMVADWNAWRSRWTRPAGRAYSPDDAAKALESLQELLKKHPALSTIAGADEWRAMLEPVTRRSDGPEHLTDTLRRLLSNPVLCKTWLVVDKDGNRFYCWKPPADRPDDAPLAFRHLKDAELGEREKTLPRDAVKHTGPAPQVAWAAAMTEMLDKMDDASWDVTMGRLVTAAAGDKNEPATDPLLRISLLRRIVEVGSQGSLPFARAYQRFSHLLDQSQMPDGACWLTPRDDKIARLRDAAEADLSRLPDPAEAEKKLQEEIGKLQRLQTESLVWVGLLRREFDGRWKCFGETAPAGQGELVVVVSAEKGLAVRPIGTLQAGTIRWKTPPTPEFVSGRPVYLRSRPGSESSSLPATRR